MPGFALQLPGACAGRNSSVTPTGMLGLPPTPPPARALARSLQGGQDPHPDWPLLCMNVYVRRVYACVHVRMCVALHPSILHVAHLLH